MKKSCSCGPRCSSIRKSFRKLRPRNCSYSPRKLYEIVADVDKYKGFLPNCVHSKILSTRIEKRSTGRIIYDRSELGISLAPKLPTDPLGFSSFFQAAATKATTFSYISSVTREEEVVTPNAYRILANADGTELFHVLQTEWRFKPLSNAEKCAVDLEIKYQLKNPVLNGLVSAFLEESNKQMIDAFERRAKALTAKV